MVLRALQKPYHGQRRRLFFKKIELKTQNMIITKKNGTINKGFTQGIPHLRRYCAWCNEIIPKKKNVGWPKYNSKMCCCKAHCLKYKSELKAVPKYLMNQEKSSISDPALAIDRQELSATLRKAMEKLTFRERTIITFRFGLNGTSSEGLLEIGKKFKISKERVRQIENKGLRKLHFYLSNSLYHPRHGLV